MSESFNTLINLLPDLLNGDLPGSAAHSLMAPPGRADLLWERDTSKAIDSSVMILLFEKEGKIHTTFIQRPKYDGVHSGQIAFPGGRWETEDRSHEETALRETQEEIGIIQDKITVLGQLSQLYIPPSNFMVYPFVGYINSQPDYILQKDEVDSIIEVPIEDFLDYRNQKSICPPGINVLGKVPSYMMNGHVIWGATAMIMAEFIYLIKKIESDINLQL